MLGNTTPGAGSLTLSAYLFDGGFRPGSSTRAEASTARDLPELRVRQLERERSEVLPEMRQ